MPVRAGKGSQGALLGQLAFLQSLNGLRTTILRPNHIMFIIDGENDAYSIHLVDRSYTQYMIKMD